VISILQIERLGDNRQDVRQAACNLLLALLQVSSAYAAKVSFLTPSFLDTYLPDTINLPMSAMAKPPSNCHVLPAVPGAAAGHDDGEAQSLLEPQELEGQAWPSAVCGGGSERHGRGSIGHTQG